MRESLAFLVLTVEARLFTVTACVGLRRICHQRRNTSNLTQPRVALSPWGSGPEASDSEASDSEASDSEQGGSEILEPRSYSQ